MVTAPLQTSMVKTGHSSDIRAPRLHVLADTLLQTVFETRAGTPMATTSSGISRTTTAPAPMMLPEPMLTPGRTAAPRPRNEKGPTRTRPPRTRSEEHTSELQSHLNLVCRLLLEKKNTVSHER